MNRANCSSCNAPILWVTTENYKRMPLDPEPFENGNIILEDGVAIFAKKDGLFDAGKPRFQSHFASCPQSAEHRKDKK
jgi:hypothetical protein